MSCERFEQALAAVMGGELRTAERTVVLEELGRHAEVCEAGCAGTRDLIELLASDPEDRDLVPRPETTYWDTFNARLTARLAAETESPGRRWSGWAAAASIAVLLAAGTWWWTQQGPEGMGIDPFAGPLLEPVELSPDLVEALERTPPDAALADLASFAGLEPGWDPQLNAADGMADALSAILPEHTEGGILDVIEDELVWEELSRYGPLFPETGELDPSVRRQLLEWLEQQMEGVS